MGSQIAQISSAWRSGGACGTKVYVAVNLASMKHKSTATGYRYINDVMEIALSWGKKHQE